MDKKRYYTRVNFVYIRRFFLICVNCLTFIILYLIFLVNWRCRKLCRYRLSCCFVRKTIAPCDDVDLQAAAIDIQGCRPVFDPCFICSVLWRLHGRTARWPSEFCLHGGRATGNPPTTQPCFLPSELLSAIGLSVCEYSRLAFISKKCPLSVSMFVEHWPTAGTSNCSIDECLLCTIDRRLSFILNRFSSRRIGSVLLIIWG